MAISGFLFLSWRIWEIIVTVPIVGMLGWLVHVFVSNNYLTPTYVLLLFIVATLALAWEFFTMVSYLRARHDALFIAFTDLCFMGGLIAGVVLLRFVTNFNCMDVHDEFVPFPHKRNAFRYADHGQKTCGVLTASFAFGILDILSFAVTFFLALLVHRNHRDDDRVVVKREYTRSSRHHHDSGRRDYNRSRDYYSNRPRSTSGRHSSRRREYV